MTIDHIPEKPDRPGIANQPTRRARATASRLLWLAAAVLSIGGCVSVGPDYAPPETRTPASWNNPLSTGLTEKAPDAGELAQWWESFHDPVLSDILRQAVSGSMDVKTARSKVREARARRGITAADRLPSIGATADYTGTRVTRDSSLGLAEERDLYNTALDASWEIDLFGGTRRAMEAADADLAAARESFHDALVSLTAETTLNYMDVRTFQTRLTAAESNLNLQQQTLELTQYRYQAGLVDELAVSQARYNLETTRAQIPVLRSGLAQAMNRLSVLTGQAPGALDKQLAERRAIPGIPTYIAVGIPAEVLRNRPDVRRSERNLAAQTARIGVATADLYPKLTLTGVIGLESLSSADLLTADSRFWKYGPGLSWKIFEGNAIRQNIEVQSALQEQALLQYEATVLSALEETENALNAFVEEQNRRESLKRAVEAAAEAARISEDKYRSGLADFESVLDAQRSLVSLEDQLAQSNGTVAAGLVRIYKSLGGGWKTANNELPTTN